MVYRKKQFTGMILGIMISTVVYLFISYTVNIKTVKIKNIKKMQFRNTLVDLSDAISNFNNKDYLRSNFQILFINKPRYIHMNASNYYIKNKCHFNNCVLSNTVKNISQMSAIVFNSEDDLHFNGSDLKKERHNSQIWIIYREEPAGGVGSKWFRDTIWKSTMNWTWGYRLDSDIFFPYQTLSTRTTQLKRDYNFIFKRKTKMAAWVVSHCHAKSLRDEYVKALIKEGIDVDIYGRCSKNKTKLARSFLFEQINTRYKFYLSFENHFCKDYITEKFFNYYPLDTILIVRGGFNYSEHFNENAFIDASSFQTVKLLAQYMLMVGNDPKLYTNFLKSKDMYKVQGSLYESRLVSTCRLCEHMNNQNRYKKTYHDIASYFENGTCFNPDKIV